MVAVVVVGVDGSPGSLAALDQALVDAARRGARLRAVAAVHPPEYWLAVYGAMPVPPTSRQLEDVRATVRRSVDGAARRLGVDVPVEVLAVADTPARALVAASADADLLVLGHRGRGAFASALLGSTGLQCVLQALCPVTVVPPTTAPVPGAARAAAHRSAVSEEVP